MYFLLYNNIFCVVLYAFALQSLAKLVTDEAANRFMAEYALANLTPRGIANYRYMLKTCADSALGNLLVSSCIS